MKFGKNGITKNVKMRQEIKLENNQIVLSHPEFNQFNMWTTWIISDTHFNHYPKTWDWPARHDGWESYMTHQWNDKIKPGQKVLHLGDFAFGNKKMVWETRQKLNGDIFMIKGNHDKHGMKWYEDVGIKMIKKPFFVKMVDETFIFSHKPLMNLNNSINVHGHIHEKGWYIRENYINMSVEKTMFEPIMFRDIVYKWRLHSFRNRI